MLTSTREMLTDGLAVFCFVHLCVCRYCTKASCPVMAAGECRYLWADKKITKPIECTAPEYVDNLMSWVESQLNDESIFPIKFDSSYPKKFHAICSTIYKRFFRVHAYTRRAHSEQRFNQPPPRGITYSRSRAALRSDTLCSRAGVRAHLPQVSGVQDNR